jgi:aspartokinase
MHARSIEVAKRFRVKVRIASSGESRAEGTLLSNEKEIMEETVIRGIATREGYHYFRADTALAKLLAAVKGRNIPLRFFASTGQDVRFVCEKEKVAQVKESLAENGISYDEVPKILLVSAVGDGLSASTEELPRFLETIEESGAPCFLVCSNSLSITAAIPASHKEAVATRLHARLIEKGHA